MTIWKARHHVAQALEAAGWSGEPDDTLGMLRHPLGPVWAVASESGDCCLDVPERGTVTFLGDVPDPVVVAACLAATDLEVVAAVAARLWKEEQDHARTRLALKSAKRRAARRHPHEREGLIFHLEQRNARLEQLVILANETARVCAQAGEDAAAEAHRLRLCTGRLRARVIELENTLTEASLGGPSPA